MTVWTLQYAAKAADQMRRLDHSTARRVSAYLGKTVTSGDPRSRGHALTGPLAGYWRYRIGDHRVIAEIQDDRLVVVAIKIGHRSQVYRDVG